MDTSTRRWAVEGLAYLTFDADVKEEFVEDEAALKALFRLSRVVRGFLHRIGTVSRIRAEQAFLGLDQRLLGPRGGRLVA